ncbi:MAG: hypothetical protein A2X08_01840 [Bacteroidetes bacterium GWA2_32_17]|nr:MAG: hypothetical protein A2X08_01840 [Bacteroidetes bacterium GWA2_32_17]
MTELNDKQWTAMSDAALVKTIGAFIKHQRLEQNKTQVQLAKESGINRETLSLFENGVSGNFITFIRILRSLNLLYMLQDFQIKQQISPLQLLKLEQTKRKRAKSTTNKKEKPKSDW